MWGGGTLPPKTMNAAAAVVGTVYIFNLHSECALPCPILNVNRKPSIKTKKAAVKRNLDDNAEVLDLPVANARI